MTLSHVPLLSSGLPLNETYGPLLGLGLPLLLPFLPWLCSMPGLLTELLIERIIIKKKSQ